MERGMSLAAVPDDDELCIGGMWQPGRQLALPAGCQCLGSGRAFDCGLIWADLADESAESGLQPFLLSGMDGGTARPGTPARRSASRRTPGPSTAWMPPSAGWLLVGSERGGTRRRMRSCGICFAPLREFTGLARAEAEELDPELMPAGDGSSTRGSRGSGWCPRRDRLTSCRATGWPVRPHRTVVGTGGGAASWEDRFGARLLEVGFDDIRLLVSRPPQTLRRGAADRRRALRVQRRGHKGPRHVGEIARAW